MVKSANVKQGNLMNNKIVNELTQQQMTPEVLQEIAHEGLTNIEKLKKTLEYLNNLNKKNNENI